ncbi:hypothetical protein P152DRAFT_448283 [Eremomyces bilateralis CBS 781.70]|uniref:Uncharacterized protein n=1 Tax=Eremomyces bilateralis CBS 781.70 TaxID=1392243 RepID=A0A6G1G7C1_9PEZI|nr:uncharacterized protein P152DRAFT_448283 [Eremomyces bilateralis CBS 781.70]KAF1813902.1 hypothetical protein P152DRAFT_448283 [Eremomyces bilateralis CBS 781.70]
MPHTRSSTRVDLKRLRESKDFEGEISIAPTHQQSTRKRRKKVSAKVQLSDNSDNEYPVERILAESDRCYLVQWEPTWEPKRNVNDKLRELWEAENSKEKGIHSLESAQVNPSHSQTSQFIRSLATQLVNSSNGIGKSSQLSADSYIPLTQGSKELSQPSQYSSRLVAEEDEAIYLGSGENSEVRTPRSVSPIQFPDPGYLTHDFAFTQPSARKNPSRDCISESSQESYHSQSTIDSISIQDSREWQALNHLVPSLNDQSSSQLERTSDLLPTEVATDTERGHFIANETRWSSGKEHQADDSTMSSGSLRPPPTDTPGRSPSAIPPTDEHQVDTSGKQLQDQRVADTPTPEQSVDHGLAIEQESSEPTLRRVNDLHKYVLLQIGGAPKDTYRKYFRDRINDIESNLYADPKAPEQRQKLENFFGRIVEDCKKIAFHDDLFENTHAQRNLTDGTTNSVALASFYRATSTKIGFLALFLAEVASREISMHFGIVASPDHPLAMVRLLLDAAPEMLGNQSVAFCIAGEPRPPNFDAAPIRITIFDARKYIAHISGSLRFVLCLGYELEAEYKAITQILNLSKQIGSQLFAVSLLISQSVDHLEHCLPDGYGKLDSLKSLVRAAIHYSYAVGELPRGWGGDDVVIERLLDFIETSDQASTEVSGVEDAEWPFPENDAVKILKSTQEVQDDVEMANAVVPTEPQEKTAEHNDTRISNSVVEPSSLATPLPTKPTILESEPLGADQLAKRYQELEYAFEVSQGQVEELRTLYGISKKENAQLAQENERLQKRIANLEARNARDQEQNQELRQAAQQASNTVLSSINTDAVDRETLRIAAQEAKEQRDSAVSRFQSQEVTFNFLRDQYNNASSQASLLKDENDVLTAENVILKKRADENSVRIHAINKEQQQTSQREEIHGLKFQIQELMKTVRRRDEEITGLRGQQNRIVTRAATPRSPRVQANSGSRAASPMPGGLGGRVGALRGNDFGA